MKRRKNKKSQYNWKQIATDAIVQLAVGIILIVIEKIING